MKLSFTKIIFLISLLLVLFVAPYKAVDASTAISFNTEKLYDGSDREKVEAFLLKTTPNLYFYIERTWWNLKSVSEQNDIKVSLNELADEFDNKIYPTLTSVFGSEWNPGVDGDKRITVFFHSMKKGVSGYFRINDEYLKLQLPDSNEREMVYLSAEMIGNERLKNSLAHEFTHLITFNKKEIENGVQEEVWLDEARAEYSSTLLGYNDNYKGSSLERRVNDFLDNPSNSLVEWQGSKYDYAVASMFAHYLVDHYSVQILIDSLKSELVGIASINEALKNAGFEESFKDIFNNWVITVYVNDCSFGENYCYLNENLENLKVLPSVNFLPFADGSSLSSTNITKNWSGSWHKVIGGKGDLKLEFSGVRGLDFSIPYILFDKAGGYSVKFLDSRENNSSTEIKGFNSDYSSLVVIPVLQSKVSGFNGPEFAYSYTIKVSSTSGVQLTNSQVLIQQLLTQIDSIKKQIAAILNGNSFVLGDTNSSGLCKSMNVNLYVGLENNSQVECLQEFLKKQGANIYPEGLVTGYFGSLTRKAVIRFQEKYALEILAPYDLTSGTGYVGAKTREKINSLLN